MPEWRQIPSNATPFLNWYEIFALGLLFAAFSLRWIWPGNAPILRIIGGACFIAGVMLMGHALWLIARAYLR